jgi:hypothetical protein
VKPTLPTLATALAGALLMVCEGSAAQTIEASRYVNAQGVEILVSRSSPKPPEASVAETPVAAARATVVASSKAVAGPDMNADAGALRRVTHPQQTSRDEERRRILTRELLTEEQQLDVKRRLLRSPRAQTDLSAQELRRVNEEVQRHEANTKALQHELAPLRAVAARGAQDKPDTTAMRWSP